MIKRTNWSTSEWSWNLDLLTTGWTGWASWATTDDLAVRKTDDLAIGKAYDLTIGELLWDSLVSDIFVILVVVIIWVIGNPLGLGQGRLGCVVER